MSKKMPAMMQSRECVNGHVWVEMLGECPRCGSDDYTIGDIARCTHPFLSVAGHPDDDECTHRDDGTDATYCGMPEAAHVDC